MDACRVAVHHHPPCICGCNPKQRPKRVKGVAVRTVNCPERFSATKPLEGTFAASWFEAVCALLVLTFPLVDGAVRRAGRQDNSDK